MREGRKRTIPGNQNIEEYRIVNRNESLLVADGFLSYDFLNNQEKFLRSRGKFDQARFFLGFEKFEATLVQNVIMKKR